MIATFWAVSSTVSYDFSNGLWMSSQSVFRARKTLLPILKSFKHISLFLYSFYSTTNDSPFYSFYSSLQLVWRLRLEQTCSKNTTASVLSPTALPVFPRLTTQKQLPISLTKCHESLWTCLSQKHYPLFVLSVII